MADELRPLQAFAEACRRRADELVAALRAGDSPTILEAVDELEAARNRHAWAEAARIFDEQEADHADTDT